MKNIDYIDMLSNQIYAEVVLDKLSVELEGEKCDKLITVAIDDIIDQSNNLNDLIYEKFPNIEGYIDLTYFISSLTEDFFEKFEDLNCLKDACWTVAETVINHCENMNEVFKKEKEFLRWPEDDYDW